MFEAQLLWNVIRTFNCLQNIGEIDIWRSSKKCTNFFTLPIFLKKFPIYYKQKNLRFLFKMKKLRLLRIIRKKVPLERFEWSQIKQVKKSIKYQISRKQLKISTCGLHQSIMFFSNIELFHLGIFTKHVARNLKKNIILWYFLSRLESAFPSLSLSSLKK